MTIIGDAQIEVHFNTDRAKRELAGFGKLVGADLVAGGIRNLASQATRAGKSILQIGISYQDQLNTFGSLGPQYAKAIGQVDKASLQLGNDLSLPATSAADAAAAMVELAKSGLSVKDALSAAKGTLQLATAGNLDTASAATIAGNALNTFGLRGTQATRVANIFANAASASSGEVADFALGLSQTGLVAKSAGLSIEETVGTLALFAQNGLKGSDAGTSLKTAILRLTAPLPKQSELMEELGINVRNSKGEFIGMGATADVLRAKLSKLTPAQRDAALATIFGQDAIRAGQLLYANGSAGIDKYERAVSRSGGAAEVAAAKSKGLGGALRGLQSQVESGMIEAFQKAAPALEPVVRQLSEYLPVALDKAVDGIGWLIPKVTELVTGFRDGEGAGGELRTVFDNLVDTGTQAGRVIRDVIYPAAKDLAQDALPVLNSGLKVASRVFEFIADHPDVFTQIAKDAVIIGLALKGKSILTGVFGSGGSGGGGGGRGLLGGASSASQIVKVYVTNPGFNRLGTPVPGRPGPGGGPTPAPGRVGAGAVLSRGAGGAVIGGTMALTADPTSAKSAGISIASAAATGVLVGGPWGAVAGAAAAAIVLGFRRGAAQAAKDQKIRDDLASLGTAAREAITSGENAILVGLRTTSQLASKGMSTDLAEVEKKLTALREQLRYEGDDDERAKGWKKQIADLEATADALRGLKMDAIQYQAALDNLAQSGIDAGEASQAVRDAAGQVDSDSPTRLANRFGDVVDKSRHASDSLRVQERDLGRVSRNSLTARDSLRALETQIERLEPKTIPITVDVIANFRTNNPGAANDPELRHITARLTVSPPVNPQLLRPGHAAGGEIRGPGTGTSDSIWTRVSNGEFIVNAAATDKYRSVLRAINDGTPLAATSYSAGGGDMLGEQQRTNALLAALLAALERVPAGTGAATAAALNKVSSQSRLRAAGRV